MKKLFTLLALTLLCVGGVKAQTYKEFNGDLIFLPTSTNVSNALTDGWLKGGSTLVTNKKGNINPATGETVEPQNFDGIGIKKGNSSKEAIFYVKNVKSIVVYGVTGSSSDTRYIVVTATPTSGSEITESKASEPNKTAVISLDLDKTKEYAISVTGVDDSNSGQDCALHGIKFVCGTVKTPVSMSFSSSTASGKVGESFTAPTIEISPLVSPIEYKSSVPSVASVASDGTITLHNAGETVITASFAGNATYSSASASYTLTVTSDGPTILIPVIDDMWDFSTWTAQTYSVGTEIVNNLEIIKETVNNIAVDANNKSIDGYNFTKRFKLGGAGSATDRTLHFKVAGNSKITVYGMSSSSGAERTAVIAAGSFSSQIGTLTNDGKAIDKTEVIYVGSETDIYIYSTSGGFNIYGIKVESNPTFSVIVGTTGFATLAPTYSLDFSSSTIKAYKATVNSSNITFTKMDQVAAGEGVLLYAEGGKTEDIPVGSKSVADTDNAFVGTLTDIDALATDEATAAFTNYILNDGASGIGFYKANGQKVAAGKAYLRVDTSAGAKTFFGFDSLLGIDGVVTGINEVKSAANDNILYNLNGVRVAVPTQKGVYILNGKKYVVK